MKTFVLIAVAFTSSLFASAPIVQESPEHIAVSKDQIIVIEDGLFVAYDGQLFPASVLFHTETGFVAEILREKVSTYHQSMEYYCQRCHRPNRHGICRNPKCPLWGKKCY